MQIPRFFIAQIRVGICFLSQRESALGLLQLPLSHSGRVGWVFQQQRPFRDGRLEDDAFELVTVRRDLGVRSMLAAAFAVSQEGRGVIVIRSVAPDHFGEPDVALLQFVAYWVTLVVQQQTSTSNGHIA